MSALNALALRLSLGAFSRQALSRQLLQGVTSSSLRATFTIVRLFDMTVTPAEALDLGSVVLGEDVEKGLVPAQVSFIKESTIEINEELMTAGQCLRAVASHLHQIKQNVRPGNWKAFLRSGAIKCSPRFATDLVNAHEKWLGGSDVADELLTGLTPRSLAAMGNASDKERDKVFALLEEGTPMTEALVRKTLKGSKYRKSNSGARNVNDQVEAWKAKCKTLQVENKMLKAQITKLKELNAIGSLPGDLS